MENETNLPFKVGEEVEVRSFESGYRGAWFRCKITEISKRKGRLGHVSEYCDFPDEKLEWTALDEVPPYDVGKAKEKHRELMLRPRYPPIYNEKQMPHANESSEVVVIVDNSWKVGDLVDWWTTDCYWSGRITQLLGDDKAEIQLRLPPFGEGSCDEASVKDLRPSLDWSPEHGWTVPTPEGDIGRPCARLIKPINQVFGRTRIDDTHSAGQETEGCGNCSRRKTSSADTDSGKNPAEPAAEVGEDLKSNHSLKKYRASEGFALYSMRSDTLEAAILDLEAYVNKVKWLKKILQYGSSSSDSRWEFVETHTASEAPR